MRAEDDADARSSRGELGLLRKLFIIGLTTLGALLFCTTEWAAYCDHFLYDRMFLFRGARPAPQDIAIVAIEEESFAELNIQWPWPRSIHGRLLDSLREAGVHTVAMDIIFAEASAEEEDRALAEAVDRFDNVVFAQYLERRQDTSDFLIIRSEALADLVNEPLTEGLADVSLDGDGTVRGLFLNLEGERAMSLVAAEQFAASTERRYPNFDPEKLGQGILIDYIGPHRTVVTIPYYQALDPERYGVTELLRDRLVFVGFSMGVSVLNQSEAVADHHPSPYGRMAGVEIHAQAASTMLRGTPIQRLPRLWVLTLSGALALISGLLYLSTSFRVAWLVAAALFGAAVVGSYSALTQMGLFAPVFTLLFPTLVCYAVSVFIQYWTLTREKKFIRNAFSTYLAPSVVEQLIEYPERLDLGGEEQEATIVFLDIAGFTSVSESLPPRELINLINRNLGAYAQIVLNWDGMIDKYIGDCIMAVWGVPLPRNDHAERACRAVVEMLNAAKVLKAKEKELTGAAPSVRIGVNSGRVIAGNVGGGQQFNYTVLGNEVNLASRLEGINKYYATSAIVSEATAVRLSDIFRLREIDRIRVVGQTVAVRIFELRGLASEQTEEQEAVAALYKHALAVYRTRQWDDAARWFKEVLSRSPEDGPSKVLYERCLEYQTHPPPEDWRHVYQMSSK